MKNIIVACLMLLGFFSSSAFADCSTVKDHQVITIAKVGGTVQVLDKNKTDVCTVKNNSEKSEKKKSTLVWNFKNLNCLSGQCFVRFHNMPTLGGMALKCDLGTANDSKCRLRVSKLSKQCEKYSKTTGNECSLSYDIVVRGQVIDPTIIIRPRPVFYTSSQELSAAYIECEAAGGYELSDDGVCQFEQ